MAQMPDDLNEDLLKEPEDSSAGLTQDALDALFAGANMDEAAGGMDWSGGDVDANDDAESESESSGLGGGYTDGGFDSNAALSDSAVADLFASIGASGISPDPTPSGMSSGSARPATIDLPSFDTGGGHGGGGLTGGESYDRVRDIPLDITVELGRTQLLIRDILDLSAGSIIELDKIAGEPVELYANGLLVARGEVIVIDDNFGVRVTEIITAATRSQAREQDFIAA